MCKRRKDRETRKEEGRRRKGGGRKEKADSQERNKGDGQPKWIHNLIPRPLPPIHTSLPVQYYCSLGPRAKTNSRSTAFQHHTHIITVMQRLQLQILSPPWMVCGVPGQAVLAQDHARCWSSPIYRQTFQTPPAALLDHPKFAHSR